MISANRKISGRAPLARRVVQCPARGQLQEMQGIPMVLQWLDGDHDGSEGFRQLIRSSRHVQDAWFPQGILRFAPNRKICNVFWQARLLRNA